MSFEVAGRSKFTEFVTYHELRYINRNELVTIVHSKRVTNEIRCNGGTATPGFDNPFLGFTLGHIQHLLLQFYVYVRTFFN